MNDFTPAEQATYSQLRAKLEPLDTRDLNALIAVSIALRCEREHTRASALFHQMAEAASKAEDNPSGATDGTFAPTN